MGPRLILPNAHKSARTHTPRPAGGVIEFDTMPPMNPAVKSVEIRHTDKFPEPDFSRLQRVVFGDVQQLSVELEAILCEEATASQAVPHVHASMARLGAYAGDEVIGWSYGWMERGNTFYMANSGVIAPYRRRGIYSSLLSAITDHALSVGATIVRSQHSVLNNPVLIAKLRAGFHVSGISQSAQMGTLVELTRYLSVKRQELYRKRVLPYVAPDLPLSSPNDKTLNDSTAF